ncbi:MAG: hypothetical protein R6W83_10850 [Cryobacterium sp.]
MRWDNLFDDLAGQLETGLDSEELTLRAEEERLQIGRLTLRGRLTSLVAGTAAPPGGPGGALRMVLLSGETLLLRPTAFGRDWLAADLLDAPSRRLQCVLPLAAIAAVVLAPDDVGCSLTAESERTARVSDRIGLPFVLRDLCRRRSTVDLSTPAGRLCGTIDRVGRDHLDLAVHEPGQPRRCWDVSQLRIVPLQHIHLVRLDPSF